MSAFAAEGRRGLGWSSAARIAFREFRSAPAKFLFVIVSVAIGVAALTGVRGFTESFEQTLRAQSRTIMAGDLSARMFRQPTTKEREQLDALGREGVDRTTVTEMVSMASVPADPVPLLVSLKAVDPAKYPFYGTFALRPDASLKALLRPDTVVVGEDLLIRLHAGVGDSLKIGNASYRIAGVVEREPDRMNSTMGLGPRVLITQAGLERSGLLQAGSRAGERFLFKLNPQKSQVAQVRTEIERILPEAQVMDFREANPALTQGLDRASSILSLICLVAMVLGAIGVAMAMRAHLQQRMDILAVMKSIGARSSDILRIYLLQTLLLGLAGGVIGVLAGFGVEWMMPTLVARLLPLKATLHIPVRAGLAGLGTGVLTTLLFCVPPLLDIRNVKPNLVLRRMVEEGTTRESFRQKWQRRKAQWVAMAVILVGMAGIAAALTSSWLVARWFTAALCGLLVSMLLLASGTLRVVRGFLSRTRLHLPSALRHGLANLYRPGNQSAAVLTALGAGVMLILAVFLMQNAIVHDMQTTLAGGVPNVFLIDISKDELGGVQALMQKQSGMRGSLETLPVVAGRILRINNEDADSLRLKNYPKHLLQSVTLTWAPAVPAGTKVRQGAWWKGDASGVIAISDHVARRLHMGVGSSMLLTAGERQIPVRVVAVFENDGQHVYGRSEFILAPKALAGLPAIWYGAAHIETAKIPEMQRALFAAYPTVTVINIADVLDTIAGIVRQITIIVHFLAAFSILAGAVILASSVASTRFRRIREVVVLKTLGARRARISAVFGIEFTVLGLLAGVVGVVFANLLTAILLHKMDVAFRVEWVASLVSVLGTALLAVATGWLASYRILGQKPLEVLREE